MSDESLRAKIREGGICADLGPAPGPGLKPYVCSLVVGHVGAHVAAIAGIVCDSWPAL